jgi:RNA polymerase sigma factor (sigma-70 family)
VNSRERETLILSLEPVVLHYASQIIRSRNLNSDMRDDLLQYGREGAIKAVDNFDSAHGASLKTYAATRILGHMLDGLRKESGIRQINGQAKRTQPETTGFDPERHDLGDGTDPYADVDISETLRATLERLPPGARQILLDHFVHGVTMVEISVLHGVSPARVSQILAQALDDAKKVATDPLASPPERLSTQRHQQVSANLNRQRGLK